MVFPNRRAAAYWPEGNLPAPLRAALEARGFWLDTDSSIERLMELCRTHQVELILYQLNTGDSMWEEAFDRLLHESMATRLVVIAKEPTVPQVVRAMKLGAAGVFEINDSPEAILSDLIPFVAKEVPPDKIPLRSGGVLLGQGESFRIIRTMIERLQTVDSTVLITGESGTGKELIAQALHENSFFKMGPFKAINCGAIPENLLESELFGHVKGAFTDAKTDHKGIFEASEGGSLLLDEVGDMPISLQVKLLRVLESRQVTPVGSTVAIPINVRVLASTNRDLEELVNEGAFRRDLFFRLAVVRLHVPPLRERREDIRLLVNHYLEYFCQRFHRPVQSVPYEVWARLLAYEWPGNIRELRNVMERAAALAHDGKLHLGDVLPDAKQEKLSFPQFCPLNPQNTNPAPFEEVKNCCEKSYLVRLLQLSHGNVSEVARLSGRHRTEIYRQLERLGLDPKTFQKT